MNTEEITQLQNRVIWLEKTVEALTLELRASALAAPVSGPLPPGRSFNNSHKKREQSI